MNWKKTAGPRSHGRLVARAALGFSAALLAAAAMAGQSYRPAFILLEMGKVRSDNVVLSAHRGVHSNAGCPENSLCAIQQTYDSNIEAIEIDVKPSKDGTLWVFHDSRVGRVTNYTPSRFGGTFDRMYDPYRDADTRASNPEVAQLPDSTLRQLRLRDKDFNVTGYLPLTLRGALQAIRDNVPHMAVQLDLKSASDARKAAEIVRQLNMTQFVVGKLGAKLVAQPSGYRDIFGNVLFAPVIQASDLDVIVRNFGNNAGCASSSAGGGFQGKSPDCIVSQYIRALNGNNQALYFEFGTKADGDPVSQFRAYTSKGKGSFNPVPDASSNRFFLATGACCTSPGATLTKTQFFGEEKADNRGNLDYEINRFNSIITDDPIAAHDALVRKGRSNWRKYYFNLVP